MRVAALISGGKDSCYNMMQCIAAGHQIVALANLRPAENQVGSDELDSYMYQTVGHHAIDLYAEAMALPLYRRTIRGRSVDTSQVYTKCEGDEVEDLYELLKLVKEKEEVEGISVGAILSDYQRVRVENVCKRLDLQPLAYLWQRKQEDLLREMISSNIQAIIIKVAALGLDPDKHLGKTLDQMEPYLLELSSKYGVHICGEGGEYETFTLDCPLFKKKIIVDSSEVVIHSADAFAPVAYLRLLELHLEDKLGEPCHIVGRVFWGFEGQHGYRKDKTRSALEDKDQKQLGELPLLSMDRANAEPGTSQDAKLSQLVSCHVSAGRRMKAEADMQAAHVLSSCLFVSLISLAVSSLSPLQAHPLYLL
uniref:Diphthine--ammonia ligase n=1 Tax=Equus caballus TaxID=9796 RepID=A0A9L0R9M9_HORSE